MIAHEIYAEDDLETLPPLGKVIALYDGAIRAIVRARTHLRAGNAGRRGEMVSRALAILHELRLALDHKTAPELAGNLDALYGFAGELLVNGNLRGEEAALGAAEKVLQTLRAGWLELQSRGAR